MAREPFTDVIVVVPGVLGSRLVRGGKEIWGVGGGVWRNLVDPGRTLALTGDGHEEDPFVKADGFVRLPAHFPGLAKVDCYGKLKDFVRPRVAPGGANLLEFTYDWRLSNDLNGRRLARQATEKLEQWRRRLGCENAKLVLICHSMGGLVARAFLDLHDGAPLCRKLITIGTPYRGAVKALGSLVNGLFPCLPWVGPRLSELARTWPSVYELLPSYRAIVGPGNALVRLRDVDVPDLCTDRFKRALAFQDRLRAAVNARGDRFPPYQIAAVIGLQQPTDQFARVTSAGVELLRQHRGTDEQGDGTVPRQGACPFEWKDETSAVFVPQAHLALPNTSRVHEQLEGVLTAVRRPMAPEFGLSVDVPELVLEGEPVTIMAQATGEQRALCAKVTDEAGAETGRPAHFTRGVATLEGRAPGIYKVTVEAAARTARGLEPVTDAFTVWPRSEV